MSCSVGKMAATPGSGAHLLTASATLKEGWLQKRGEHGGSLGGGFAVANLSSWWEDVGRLRPDGLWYKLEGHASKPKRNINAIGPTVLL